MRLEVKGMPFSPIIKCGVTDPVPSGLITSQRRKGGEQSENLEFL